MNEIQKVEKATDQDVVRFYTRLNTFFGIPGDEAQILLFATVLLRENVTKAQLEFMENRAYVDADLAKGIRYKTPLFPALLLNLLKGTSIEHHGQKKRYSHFEAIAYMGRYPGKKMNDLFDTKIGINGGCYWVLKQ